MIKAFIFDQDGTFYPKKHRLTEILRARTKNWLCNELNLSMADVNSLYLSLQKKHPNPYNGFSSLGLDPKDYVKEVFDKVEPQQYLKNDKKLIKLLGNLWTYKFVVTLASTGYSQKLHEALGIDGLIDNVFSLIDFLPYTSKSCAYDSLLKGFGLKSNEVCVVGDNFPVDIQPALEKGYHAVFIGERPIEYQGICLENIHDLTKIIPNFVAPE